MKLLHTSDWHLGKTLDKFERYEEQEQFIEELITLCDTEAIDLVLIAGDIYDVANPPARAETLLYTALRRLSGDGKRGVVVIAGNHDNPERITAPGSLAREHGVLLCGLPQKKMDTGVYGCMEVIKAGEGYVEVEIRGEKAVIGLLPYPSEKRLNEVFDLGQGEEDTRLNYGEKMQQLFKRYDEVFLEDAFNLLVTHLYTLGGQESPDSERPIQMGGSYVIDGGILPQKADYIALGHLHKAQQVKGSKAPAYYAGSPIQYSKNESHIMKSVTIVEKIKEQPIKIKQSLLRNYKPIDIWKVKNIAEALEKAQADGVGNAWIYLDIISEVAISATDIKELRRLCPNLIEINVITPAEYQKEEAVEVSKTVTESFVDFFRQSKNQGDPSPELIALFQELLGECEEDET